MFISLSILFNALIYNLIIIPIKTIVMTYHLLSNRKVSVIKYKMNIIKLSLFIIGVYLYYYLEYSYIFFFLQDKLKRLKGIKIFALLKIIEFAATLLNRCLRDFDILLLSLASEKKIKKCIFLYGILVITLALNIFSFIAYMSAISISLNENSTAIYPLYFKVNYIELKKCAKGIKKKILMGQLITDIYDRFFNMFALTCVLFINYNDNMISLYSTNDYIYKFFFTILFEIMFDWFKDYIIFKISGYNTKMVKLIAYEIGLYYEKLRYKCYNSKSGDNIQRKRESIENYVKFLDSKELIIVSKQDHYEKKYSDYFDAEVIMCLTMKTNIFLYCIIFIGVFYRRSKISILVLIILIIAFIIIRKFLQYMISYYVIRYYKKNDGKLKESMRNEAELYVNDPMKKEIYSKLIKKKSSNKSE